MFRVNVAAARVIGQFYVLRCNWWPAKPCVLQPLKPAPALWQPFRPAMVEPSPAAPTQPPVAPPTPTSLLSPTTLPTSTDPPISTVPFTSATTRTVTTTTSSGPMSSEPTTTSPDTIFPPTTTTTQPSTPHTTDPPSTSQQPTPTMDSSTPSPETTAAPTPSTQVPPETSIPGPETTTSTVMPTPSTTTTQPTTTEPPTPTDPCHNVLCREHAACQALDGVATCACMPGYTGQADSCVPVGIPPDPTQSPPSTTLQPTATTKPPPPSRPCAGVQCPAHAHCEVRATSGLCVCDQGYTLRGNTCVLAGQPTSSPKPTPSTSPKPRPSSVAGCEGLNGGKGCSTNGYCTPQGGSLVCRCYPDYTGDGFTCTQAGTPTTTPDPAVGASSISGGAIAGIVIGCFILALVLGLFGWWRWRRGRKADSEAIPLEDQPGPAKKTATPSIHDHAPFAPPLPPRQGRSSTSYLPFYSSHSTTTSPRPSPPHLYADITPVPPTSPPTNYSALYHSNQADTAGAQAVREAVRQGGTIDRSMLVKLQLLGEGCYGCVYEGALYKGGQFSPVAIKELRVTERDQVDAFVAEAALMRTLEHDNIVGLIGTTPDRPLCIVLELMPLGDLHTYLRTKVQVRQPISTEERLWYSYQIARGMAYLAQRGIVHRDLAARNCMLGNPTPSSYGMPGLKVSDFGLSRVLDRGDHQYYRMQSSGRVPIPWLAPEALTERLFTSASDVWAYGVTVWEVMADGQMPYSGMNAMTLAGDLASGYRLERPLGCPQAVYELMTQCWLYAPPRRPSMHSVAQRAGTLFAAVCHQPVTTVVVDGDVQLRAAAEDMGYVETVPSDTQATPPTSPGSTYIAPDGYTHVRPLPPTPLPTHGGYDQPQ